MSAGADSPGLAGVLETCLYHSAAETDGDRAVLRRLASACRWSRAGRGRSRCGSARECCCCSSASRSPSVAGRSPTTAPRAADTPACWRPATATTRPGGERIAERGIEITHEHEWDGGRRSFYFHDPAGNLLEIADGDLWPER